MTKSEAMLSLEKVREMLAYDPGTGRFTWRISISRNKAGDKAGVFDEKYVRVGIGGKLFQAHRLAWFYTFGVWPADKLDHENRIKTDNRIQNLREIDSFGNCQNVAAGARNTSGYKGVHPYHGKWRASIYHRGKTKYLGVFDDVREAANAYAKGAAEYHTHNPAATQ